MGETQLRKVKQNHNGTNGHTKVEERASEPGTEVESREVAPGGAVSVTPPPQSDAALDAQAASLRGDAASFRATLPAAAAVATADTTTVTVVTTSAVPAPEGDRKLVAGEWAADWAVLDTVDLRPARFEVTGPDGKTMVPADTATPRSQLQEYKSLETTRATLVTTIATIDFEMARLGGAIRPPVQALYNTAKTAVKGDVLATATLGPASQFHGASAASRRSTGRAEREMEQNLSPAELATRQVSKAQARADREAALQAKRVAAAPIPPAKK